MVNFKMKKHWTLCWSQYRHHIHVIKKQPQRHLDLARIGHLQHLRWWYIKGTRITNDREIMVASWDICIYVYMYRCFIYNGIMSGNKQESLSVCVCIYTYWINIISWGYLIGCFTANMLSGNGIQPGTPPVYNHFSRTKDDERSGLQLHWCVFFGIQPFRPLELQVPEHFYSLFCFW